MESQASFSAAGVWGYQKHDDAGCDDDDDGDDDGGRTDC